MRIALWTALALTIGTLPLAADIYYLKDGGRIEGSGKDLGDRWAIAVPLGEVVVDKSEVVRIVPRTGVLDLYRDRKARTAASADALYDLALWCESAGLRVQARTHLREVLGLNPDHAGARARLGYRKVGRRWLTDDEWHRWRGEIRFRNRWMPPETVAAILQAEALQVRLAAARKARGAGPGAIPPPAGAGGAAGGGGGAQGGGQAGGGAPGGPPAVRLARSLRPSRAFLEKYFVTNPFMVGTAGARIVEGNEYTEGGAIFIGPYPYDLNEDGLWTRVYDPVRSFGLLRSGALTGRGRRRGGRGRRGPGGLNVGYGIGDPGDKFVLRGNLFAGGSGGNSFVGHSFSGRFNSGSTTVRFAFR